MTLLGTFALRYTLRARVGSTDFTKSPSSSEHSSCDGRQNKVQRCDVVRWKMFVFLKKNRDRPCPPSATSPVAASGPAGGLACRAPETQTYWAGLDPARCQSTGAEETSDPVELEHSGSDGWCLGYAEFPGRRMDKQEKYVSEGEDIWLTYLFIFLLLWPQLWVCSDSTLGALAATLAASE